MKLFLAGPPCFWVVPRIRQRLNLAYQERINRRSWSTWSFNPSIAPLTLFLHIPKNAGSSVSEELMRSHGFERMSPGRPIASRRLIVTHYSVDWLIRNKLLSRSALEAGYSFAMVRHPLPRALSCYAYLRRKGMIPPDWSLHKYLRFVALERPKVGGARVSRLSHAAPQMAWLRTQEWSGLSETFRVGDLSSAEERLGEVLGRALHIPKTNQSGSELLAPSQKDIRLIERLYKDDYANLGFAMEDSRIADRH